MFKTNSKYKFFYNDSGRDRVYHGVVKEEDELFVKIFDRFLGIIILNKRFIIRSEIIIEGDNQ